jgi:hypothetical protein
MPYSYLQVQPEVVGSDPTPATNYNKRHKVKSCAFFYFYSVVIFVYHYQMFDYGKLCCGNRVITIQVEFL